MKNKNSRLKGCLTVFAWILIPVFLLAAAIMWRTEYKKTEVIISHSEDGRSRLVVYMIGEPAWPFGPTDCRFELFSEDKNIAKYSFKIRDDGVTASEGNFDIFWNQDHVRVIVSGTEQEDVEYLLYLDGRVLDCQQ